MRKSIARRITITATRRAEAYGGAYEPLGTDGPKGVRAVPIIDGDDLEVFADDEAQPVIDTEQADQFIARCCARLDAERPGGSALMAAVDAIVAEETGEPHLRILAAAYAQTLHADPDVSPTAVRVTAYTVLGLALKAPDPVASRAWLARVAETIESAAGVR